MMLVVVAALMVAHAAADHSTTSLTKAQWINQVTEDGRTLLFLACENGHVDTAQLLLDEGADVDRANRNGATPLWIASKNGHVDAAQLLLDKGAQVDRADKYGQTALYAASYNGHVDVAQLLLDRGAEVDRANEDGTTPLHIAVFGEHVEAVRLLLDKGADVNWAMHVSTPPKLVGARRGNLGFDEIVDPWHAKEGQRHEEGTVGIASATPGSGILHFVIMELWESRHWLGALLCVISAFSLLAYEVTQSKAQIEDLKRDASTRDTQITRLRTDVTTRDAQIADLQRSLLDSTPRCTICLAKAATMAFKHGGTAHLALCEECHGRWSQTRQMECPICRARYEEIVQVFWG